MPLTLSVVVPSFKRPLQLLDCLTALRAQTHPVDQVIVVLRTDDEESHAALGRRTDLYDVLVDVQRPGQIAALAAGAGSATTEIIAFTDDDAVPHTDWAARMLVHYDDPSVGAVGGRDELHPPRPDRPQPSSAVGRITRWGRLEGFHHVGQGPPVDVDILKGVNRSYRVEALALPRSMRGEGAQVHNEVATSLWARSHAWRAIYDPAVQVEHYWGVRHDSDQRRRPAPIAIQNATYNLVWTMLAFRPELFWRRALYGLLVGDGAASGLLRALGGVVHGEPQPFVRLVASLRGQVEALVDIRRGRLPDMITFSPERSP